MNPEELASRVQSQLRAHADEEFRRGVANFFKEPVNPYGVRGPDVKAIAREAYRELKLRPPAERNRFATALWKTGRLEASTVAIWTYRRFAKQCGACEFALFERWLDRYVNTWANCDGLASWLLAAAIENEPALIERLSAWAASSNRWKRRASIVALLQEAKHGRHTREILELAATLLCDSDDMVQKGVGWVLKEAYPKKSSEVMRFLLPRAGAAPRLVLRLAAEKMSERDRATLRKSAQDAARATAGRRSPPRDCM